MFKISTKTQFVMSKPRTFQQVRMPCPQPSPQTGSRAQGSQEELTPPLQNSLHSDWSVEVVDEVSPGRGIPLGRDYGLPPPGNTCQDVRGKSPGGFPRSDLGWLHPNLDMDTVFRARDRNPCPHASHAPPSRSLSSPPGGTVLDFLFPPAIPAAMESCL